MISPRAWQRRALRKLADATHRRTAIVAPTGTGKTVVFAHHLAALREAEPDLRSVILAHRDELVEQSVSKLQMIDPATPVGVVKAERNEVDAPSIVASVQTLAYSNRINQLMKAGPPHVVIVDEAHHAQADSYQKILRTFGCFEDYGPLLTGVTATLERADGKALGKTFPSVVYRLSMLQAIKKGYIVPPRGIRVRLAADFRELREAHGAIRDDDAAEMLMRSMAPDRIAEAIAEHAEGRKIIVFCPRIDVSLAVSTACRKLGIEMNHLDATTPMERRREMIGQLNRGEANITNVGVLTEGADIPIVDCIVMARPTKSKVFYIQAVGRGTRLYPGKEDCLVLDLVGTTHRHDLISCEDLLTEEEEPVIGEPRGEREPSVYEEESDGELVAEDVDLFASRPFAWIRTSFGYVLDLARNGWVCLTETPAGWSVDRLIREDGQNILERVQVMPAIGYAQGLAEDYVRKLGVEALAKRDARWRDMPHSMGQRQFMDSMRILYHPKWTKGQCSDSITKTLAERAMKEVWRAV